MSDFLKSPTFAVFFLAVCIVIAGALILLSAVTKAAFPILAALMWIVAGSLQTYIGVVQRIKE